jgi:hypothetical protein
MSFFLPVSNEPARNYNVRGHEYVPARALRSRPSQPRQQLRHAPGLPFAAVGRFLTAQPRARSAVFGVDEDDAGLFERTLYCFDGAWPH